MANKLKISIKIDSASRLGRNVIGINVQYIRNGVIKLRTLELREANDRQTAIYIKNVIIDVLNSFDIKLNQVYSITSDNGRNMIKSAELLRNEFEEAEDDAEDEEYENDETIIVNGTAGVETLAISHSNIIHFKCVAHTIQLAVSDTISSVSFIKQSIEKCRNIAKKLRAPNRATLARKFGLKKAILDCPTRWNSTYDMLQRLLDYRTFCSDIMDSELSMDANTWDFCSDFVEVFEPVKKCTLQLQNEQLNLGDFYGLWVKFKLDLENHMKKKPLAGDLYSKIIKREASFINNELLSAAIYLDPRFKLLLNEENTGKAKTQILKTIKNLKSLQMDRQTIGENMDVSRIFSSSSDDENDHDVLEEILKTKEKSLMAATENEENDKANCVDFIIKKEFDGP